VTSCGPEGQDEQRLIFTTPNDVTSRKKVTLKAKPGQYTALSPGHRSSKRFLFRLSNMLALHIQPSTTALSQFTTCFALTCAPCRRTGRDPHNITLRKDSSVIYMETFRAVSRTEGFWIEHYELNKNNPRRYSTSSTKAGHYLRLKNVQGENKKKSFKKGVPFLKLSAYFKNR